MAWILLFCSGSKAGAGEDAGAAARDEAHSVPADAASDKWAAAQRDLDLAQEASRAGDLLAAHRYLNEAYALFPDARLLYNLAQIERALNRPVDALEHYEQFLREIDRDDRSLDKRIAMSKQYLTDLRRFGEVQVVTSAPVEVIVDGEPATAEPIVVLVGKHVVKVRIGGKETLRELEIQPGQRARIEPGTALASNPPASVRLKAPNIDSQANIAERLRDDQPGRSVHRPIYRRWQFWATVGGVLAAAGATILISRSLLPPMCPVMDECRHFPGSQP